MLPLLPALILLLLNGPAGLDQVAHVYSPEALKALHRQSDSSAAKKLLNRLRGDTRLASLLSDAKFCGVIAELLAQLEEAPAAPLADDESVGLRIQSKEALNDPPDLSASRSRDGPFTV